MENGYLRFAKVRAKTRVFLLWYFLLWLSGEGRLAYGHSLLPHSSVFLPPEPYRWIDALPTLGQGISDALPRNLSTFLCNQVIVIPFLLHSWLPRTFALTQDVTTGSLVFVSLYGLSLSASGPQTQNSVMKWEAELRNHLQERDNYFTLSFN